MQVPCRGCFTLEPPNIAGHFCIAFEGTTRLLDVTEIKPGDTLGRYEILTPVAQGGMAAVWAARMVGSRGFQKLVAVKTMLPALSDDPDFETMFLDEARLASRIHHPHVVEIVDLGDEHGWLYIVMEWVDGETIFTLNKRAKAKGGIPLPLLLRIASSTCAGLHSAHETRDEKTGARLDLVHRDISPQNIMISANGIVKIVDFGIAKAAGRMHNTMAKGILKGKVPYGSPEQLSGGKIDRRSDIFALGILMYVMLTGRHPFKGETDQKTMENICTRAPVPLHQLLPTVPADVEALVMRALEKEPDKRWPDCAAMQRAMDQALSALGVTVTDGDVAAFIQTMVGDLIEQRRTKLKASIEHADNESAVLPSADTTSVRRSSMARGGAPLPATFKGIIPVSLDDESASSPVSSPSPISQPTSTVSPPVSTSPPASVVAPTRKRSSAIPIFLVVLIALIAAGVVALRAGYLPGIASQLPPSVREMLVGAAPAPEPTPAPLTPQAPASSVRSVVAAEPSATTSALPSPAPTADLEQPADASDAGPSADASAADAESPEAESSAQAPEAPPANNGRTKRHNTPVTLPKTPRTARPLIENPYGD